jgi:hypothetical protein
MAKTTQPTQKELDKIELTRLLRIISPTGADMDSIETLYKRYIDANARPARRGGCNTCGNSIVVYWRNLTTWFQKNIGNF